jgi:glutaconate CoA-transferase subunit B
MIVAMKHEKRRFVEKVDFITSPGFIRGGASRRESGLLAGGMYRVVTDLAVMGFEAETRAMQVLALHPGVTLAEVRDNTGFELLVARELDTTAPPSERELAVLRHLDPDKLYIA